MRTFIGIRISEEVKKNIYDVAQKVSLKLREARVVPPENLHITLKFLGEVEESRLEVIKDILGNICNGFKPLKLQIKGLGVFPNGKEVRVLWAGVDSGGFLKSLNIEIEEEFKKLGFPKEKRFKEHITISRFKSAPNLSVLQNLIDKYSDYSFGNMSVKNVEFIQSILTGSSPVYKVLFEAPFSLST